MNTQNFGEFFRLKRIELGLTLRAFCLHYNYDPGNISRLERNILSPSLDNDKLAALATALRIMRGSQEWVLFHDLAHAAKGQIPEDIKNNQEVTNFLPAFFRTMRNKKLSKDKLQKLIELLNK
ncbi:helix-turn-helix domain-containing protein [Patescibacteria group bacterium]|nr:helix-turn-helix domain-containing protein [Patescibacteria group bacterium]